MTASGNAAQKRVWTLYDSGRRSLNERLYREAEACLSEYLSREPKTPKSANRRARAHCLIALAILSRTPPLSRSQAEVDEVRVRLLNADRLPLARVLAALVLETFYQDDGWNIPEDLQVLAKTGAVDELAPGEVAQLVEHLSGMFGPTWERVRRLAGVFGVDPAAPATISNPRPDRWRREGVPRYFAVIPPKPPDPQYGVAWSLVVGGLSAAALTFGVRYATSEWYSALAVIVFLFGVAGALLFFGVIVVRDCSDRRRKIRERNAMIAANEPQPTEAELDRWLAEDVDAAVQRGADRHRLDIARGATSGGLVIPPQVIVGVSPLSGPQRVERLVRDLRRPSGLRTAIENVPLARSRVGADGQLRASHYRVLVLYLTQRRLGVFECDVELATRRRLSETTHSFSYDDVVTMSSRRRIADKSKNVLVGSDGVRRPVYGDNRFFLTLVNGGHIEVSTAVAETEQSDTDSAIAWPNARVQRSIERMVWALKDSRNQ
jgi:hypothetical protein